MRVVWLFGRRIALLYLMDCSGSEPGCQERIVAESLTFFPVIIDRRSRSRESVQLSKVWGSCTSNMSFVEFKQMFLVDSLWTSTVALNFSKRLHRIKKYWSIAKITAKAAKTRTVWFLHGSSRSNARRRYLSNCAWPSIHLMKMSASANHQCESHT